MVRFIHVSFILIFQSFENTVSDSQHGPITYTYQVRNILQRTGEVYPLHVSMQLTVSRTPQPSIPSQALPTSPHTSGNLSGL